MAKCVPASALEQTDTNWPTSEKSQVHHLISTALQLSGHQTIWIPAIKKKKFWLCNFKIYVFII